MKYEYRVPIKCQKYFYFVIMIYRLKLYISIIFLNKIFAAPAAHPSSPYYVNNKQSRSRVEQRKFAGDCAGCWKIIYNINHCHSFNKIICTNFLKDKITVFIDFTNNGKHAFGYRSVIRFTFGGI